ncbi:hypothetical protein [Solibacillus sp. FSL H8-0538]|uniref:hypothetical protein n=1 Tax=Solibacillus sp. FSL H8-0538 TaxID=2921400 RepID=UPI0030F9C6B8
MPNNRFYKRWAEAFQISKEVIIERQVILQLAHAETDRKYHRVRYELEEMKKKLATTSPNTNDYVLYQKEVTYLQQCLDGWQQTLDHIAIWQKELDGNGAR